MNSLKAKPCNALHPMIRLDPTTMSEEQQSVGEWWQCPRCDKVAVIPHENVGAGGRHKLA